MATFVTTKPAVNRSNKKGAHSHLILVLDGTATFNGTDKASKVEDKVNGLSFKIVNQSAPAKSNRMTMKIRFDKNIAGAKPKDTDPMTGTLTVTLTVGCVTACPTIPVNYLTEDDPCAM